MSTSMRCRHDAMCMSFEASCACKDPAVIIFECSAQALISPCARAPCSAAQYLLRASAKRSIVELTMPAWVAAYVYDLPAETGLTYGPDCPCRTAPAVTPCVQICWASCGRIRASGEDTMPAWQWKLRLPCSVLKCTGRTVMSLRCCLILSAAVAMEFN